MEANKIKGEAKAIKLANGAELTYCERGESNEEIVIMPGFFFYTFMPMLEGLAERYHVYGVIMRFDGPGDELNEDGSINWTRQWGKDIYDFCQAMGIQQYIHFGKCHGSVPGWYMDAIRNDFSSRRAGVEAIKAGCDMILNPGNFRGSVNTVIEAVESGEISETRIDESVNRILFAKRGL